MPKRTDIESILIIGAGPIVIGQACEFDYSGTQACKALRQEGYRVILVNSNPATIMTDPEMADATYIEPITEEIVTRIIFQLAVILLAAKVAGEVCIRYLRVPPVLGELAAGVAIGPFALGALQIGGVGPLFPVPHDAREPCQFVFAGAGRRLGVLSDTGHITPHIAERLAGCDALALEANHDLESLHRGPYPESVKRRVASSVGHLNNDQAARLLETVGHPDLQWVVALHISEQNNSPDDVRNSLAGRLTGDGQTLYLAAQNTPSEWLEIT